MLRFLLYLQVAFVVCQHALEMDIVGANGNSEYVIDYLTAAGAIYGATYLQLQLPLYYNEYVKVTKSITGHPFRLCKPNPSLNQGPLADWSWCEGLAEGSAQVTDVPNNGDTAVVQLVESGDWIYICRSHSDMIGYITVIAAPATSAPTTGANGDPHLHFAHGGSADFRGREGYHHVMLSAPSVQFSLRTTNATHDLKNMDTMWKWKRIEGSFFTEAAWVIRGTDNERYGIWTDATAAGCKIFRLNGTSTVLIGDFNTGWREWSRFGFRVTVRQVSVTVFARGWEMSVYRRFIYNRVNGPKNRFDLRMRPNKRLNFKWGMPSSTCHSHGIIGQSYDGDTVSVSGRRDNYNVPESTIRTSAMAEGAIEGHAWEYVLPQMFSTNFIYSRFDRSSSDVCRPRDISKLVKIEDKDSEFVATSDEMDSDGRETSTLVEETSTD